MARRCPRIVKEWFEEGPKWFQDHPNWSQMGRRQPKIAQDRPNMTPRGRKIVPKWPEVLAERYQNGAGSLWKSQKKTVMKNSIYVWRFEGTVFKDSGLRRGWFFEQQSECKACENRRCLIYKNVKKPTVFRCFSSFDGFIHERASALKVIKI